MTGAVSSPWYALLATIVGFNTLIYVGLTLSKLVPWPQQFRPAQVRGWLERSGRTITEESTVKDIPRARPAESDDPFDALRYDIARQAIPQTLALAGGLVMLFSITAAFLLRNLTFNAHVVEFLAGLALLILGVVLWYGGFAGRTLMRILAVVSTVVTLGLLVEGIALRDLAPIGYSLVVITAYMPLVLDWAASLVAGAVILVAVGTAGLRFSAATGIAFTVLALSGLLVGALLLHIRLQGVRALVVHQARSAALATTDELTDLLNQRGILTVAPVVAANAARAGRPVFLASVLLQPDGKAYQEYGVHYSLAVIRSLSAVVRAGVDDGDLVARWEGNEIIILGQGPAPEASLLKERFDAGLAATGVALGRWPIEVSVGSVTANPDNETFESMLQQARALSVKVR